MYPILFGLAGALLAAGALWLLLGLRRTHRSPGTPVDLVFCGNCRTTQRALRWPTSLAASDPGGWSCSGCGAELDGWEHA